MDKHIKLVLGGRWVRLNIVLKFHVFTNFCRFSELTLPESVTTMAQTYNFDVLSCKFGCEKEELRPPRIVRVGIFQNKIPLCPETPIVKQREAVHKMAKEAITTAAAGGVNIFCFQETWSKFCYMIEAKLFEHKRRGDYKLDTMYSLLQFPSLTLCFAVCLPL